MLNLKTPAALEAASKTVACPTLQKLLADRLADSLSLELQDQTQVVVVEPGDSQAALSEALGHAPTGWAFREQHGPWCEYMYLANDGFAQLVFVNEFADALRSREGEAR